MTEKDILQEGKTREEIKAEKRIKRKTAAKKNRADGSGSAFFQSGCASFSSSSCLPEVSLEEP
ncbi:hypothetical protein [Bacillus sp. P14.5]|uniref:hypothetical protein n=1 Tax=Bacillus sp. P14.5 TaxID=1983400 RepID=UPI000DEB8A2B|nr:hypothetical protein [Bacillus sp. P14.5]